jgi:xanthine/uracil/vitamin C permease (AzgA family)
MPDTGTTIELILMPFTFSITAGIGADFVTER